MMKKNIVVLCFLLLSLFLTFSDVFLLKDGTTIIGKIIKRDEDTSFILTNYGEISVDNDNIQMSFLTKENYDKYITEKSENERLKKELENKTNLTEKELELEKERIRLQNEAELARIKLEQDKLEYEKTKNEITKNIEKKDLTDDKMKINVFYTLKELSEYMPLNKKHDSEKIYWRRHFLNLSLLGGFSYANYDVISENEYYNYFTSRGFAGNMGFSFSYLYALNNNVALGVGGFGLFGLGMFSSYSYSKDGDTLDQSRFLSTFIVLTSGLITFNLMIGDLKINKIGFLLDIGVGWLGAIKIGVFVKGFIFKIGYNLAPYGTIWGKTLSVGSITFDVGYGFNWAYKPKGK